MQTTMPRRKTVHAAQRRNPSRRAAQSVNLLGNLRLRRALAFGLTSGVLLAMIPMADAAAAPVVGDAVASYTEQSAPIVIGDNLTITGASSYGGGYVDFAVDSAGTSEFLSLKSDTIADTDAGVVSIVGGIVYLGNGVGADVIGSVDGVHDGEDGRMLRVNFTSPFTNPSFEEGGGSVTGWTPMTQWIDLGVTKIPSDGYASLDTSTYSMPTGGSGTTPLNDDAEPPLTGAQGPLVWTTQINTDTGDGSGASDGQYALRLESSMTTAGQCDIVHGPAVYSDTFEAAQDDEIFFDWKASGSGDNYHVFGYIVDEAGNQTEVLDATGPKGSTPWAEKATTIPSDGKYRFVFVSGTFDYTCGTLAGASLLIDNVRVYGSKVQDTVLQDIVNRLQYENTSDDPAATRTINVTAVDNTEDGSGNGTDSGAIALTITAVDDAPTLTDVTDVIFENTEATQAFAATANLSGALDGNDPDGTLGYSIDNGIADAETVGGVAYTHSLAGAYGILRINAVTGAYVYVPDDAAINGQATDDSESFTFVATADGESAAQSFTLTVNITESASSAPELIAATPAPEKVNLSWNEPSWIGGDQVTGYKIEQSTNAGALWSSVVENTGTTATTEAVAGLDNGVEASFRISAINDYGTSGVSNVKAATPVAPPSAPRNVTVTAGDTQATLTWAAPLDDGGSPVTGYRIEKSADPGHWITVVADTASTNLSYAGTGLVNGDPVSFRIVALNAVGASPKSLTVYTTSRTVAGAATALQASPGDTKAHLSWTAPADNGGAPVTGYLIEIFDETENVWDAVATTTIPDTAYMVAGLANGVEVTFRVTPVNVAGIGAASNEASATPRSTPDAPRITSIASTNRTVTVSFIPPVYDGGSRIVGYQYSIDGGNTWLAAAGMTSPMVISALDNGKTYPLLMRAVNVAGAGAFTPSNNAVPTLEPLPGEGSLALPIVQPGASELVVNGMSQPVSVSRDNGTWTVSARDFGIVLEGTTAAGAALPMDAQGSLLVMNGGSVRVSGTGFRAGSVVDVWLLGGRHLLGEATVGVDGAFHATFALPEGAAIGSNTIQLNGISDDGELRSLSTGLVVLAAAAETALAASGVNVFGMGALAIALLACGMAGIIAGRSRYAFAGVRHGTSPRRATVGRWTSQKHRHRESRPARR